MFERKQLKADPRLKPDDLEVDLSHLEECTSCRQRARSLTLQHEVAGRPVKITSGWQLLVDDYTIHSWRNILRFLNPPDKQQIVLEPNGDSHAAGQAPAAQTRFGCPCTVLRTSHGFRLYHAAGTIAGAKSRYAEWPGRYLTATSSNGKDWKHSQAVIIDGFTGPLTGSLSVALHFYGNQKKASKVLRRHPRFVAGYEGANSRVCLAHSRDGKFWITTPTGPKITFSQKHQYIMSRFQKFGRNPWAPRQNASNDAEKAVWTPAHLMKDLSSFVGRPKDQIKKRIRAKVCLQDVKACKRAGASFRSWWGRDANHPETKNESRKRNRRWSVAQCLEERFNNGSMSHACQEATDLNFSKQVGQIDCVDRTHSSLGRAADCNVQPIYDSKLQRQLVWYRRDFGTQGGWREIRGVQVVSVGAEHRQEALWQPQDSPPPSIERVGSYYFDRLGKLERFRRQIYSVTFTRYNEDLWLGLMTVIEWAKDNSEQEGDQLPAFERDTTSIFLVTSRDWVHIDDEWVYARRPLIPKGKLQRDWNSGMQLAASEITPDWTKTLSRVYFEARRLRHEDRFKKTGVIGMASWTFNTLVGLRVADPTVGAGIIVTKEFSLNYNQMKLLLNVDTTASHCGNGSVMVEILDADGDPGSQSASHRALPIADWQHTAAKVKWIENISNEISIKDSISIKPEDRMRIRFTILGTGRLYAFHLVGV